jgi:hypothetical protein
MDIRNIVCNTQLANIASKNLTVTTELEGVVPLPSGQLGSVVVAVAFSKTTVPFSAACETTGISALVHGLGDPVNPGITADLWASIL